MDEVDKNAKVIWDYMQMNMPLHKCDVILGLGGLDVRPAQRSAELFLQGYGDWLVFSGGFGGLTKHSFNEPEAEKMAKTAIEAGVPEEKVIKEPKATNTGENINFSHELLKERGIDPKSILLVTKNYFERRAYATFKKLWPDSKTEILVTSPRISYVGYFNEQLPKDLVINVMVGDLQRIKEYPKLGYQIEQDIPEQVWAAYEQLIKAGYTKRLIKESIST